MKAIQKIHQRLVEYVGSVKDAVILDYGCGKGGLIEQLLEQHDRAKKIIGVDSHDPSVRHCQLHFIKEINSGELQFFVCSEPARLQEKSFDIIFCHNVLECVADKELFVTQLMNLLVPSGLLILSHHDFDSAIYNSAYKELTRELVHCFADSKQDWQQFHDGQMGRKIPGVIYRAGFMEAQFEIWRIVEQKFDPDGYGHLMSSMISDGCKNSFQITDINAWKNDLESKSSINDYFFAIDVMIAKVFNKG